MRILLVALLLVTAVGVVLWVGLDAVMRSVTEMERNMGGARQAVKNDRPAYVEDNCRALDLVPREGMPGKIYNIGSGEERTNLEVTEAILDAVDGSQEQISFVEDRAGHDQRYALDTDKIGSLGWELQWSFEDGLKETVAYYL